MGVLREETIFAAPLTVPEGLRGWGVSPVACSVAADDVEADHADLIAALVATV